MKYRDYKQFGQGEYYHIYNRGNAKQDIFLDDNDFLFFLLRLKQNLFPDKFGNSRNRSLPVGSFSLISYCLMSNHFHFLLRQNAAVPTTKLLQRICTSYSIYFNKRYKHVGHVFQDQYKQVLINSDPYLVWLSAYIHNNPVVAGLVNSPARYRWSSYPEFINSGEENICEKRIILSQFSNQGAYEKFMQGSAELIKKRKILEHLLLDFE